MKQGQFFPAVLPLGSLNGQNGFKLDGESEPGESGYSVSGAGDINGDGIADLVIGSPGYIPNGNRIGRSYVVFGGFGVGSSGDISLGSLNGANGFKLDGENYNDYTGSSVSSGGDINGDGYTDLLIGAYGYPQGNQVGRTYVVFGGPAVGHNGTISLASLNGINGFKLDGENDQDNSGYSISSGGDINGDGYGDVLIGADAYSIYTSPAVPQRGRTYVVFGGPTVGHSGTLSLSGLNGTQGFKLNGENEDDYSGHSVRSAGDINGDGYGDLVIGAYGYPSDGGKGRSYVVFGGPGVGKDNNGTINLSSLNGTNGFKMDGENIGDASGFSVSAAGDVNRDGYPDLLIGAYNWNTAIGRIYVVFGGPKVGLNETILLSSLNGTNGFKLDGEAAYNYCGYSVSSAGDINADGYADVLIGDYGYPTDDSIYSPYDQGRSYVVFGSRIYNGTIALSSLNGTNGFRLDGENEGDYSGYSVSSVGDINSDGVVDLVIGAYEYSQQGTGIGRTYVVFGDIPPVLVNNNLYVWLGGRLIVRSNNLYAYDRNHNNNTLVFVLSNVLHGFFSTLSAPLQFLANFTQEQVINSSIQFVHDGSNYAPSYNITVRSNGGIAWTGPWPANITFGLTPMPTMTSTPTSTSTPGLSPITLLSNQLTLSNGQTVVLSPGDLQASEAGFNNSRLIFNVSNVQNGYFTTTSIGVGKSLTGFTQGQIQSGSIEFVHNGQGQAPSYLVLVSDGRQSTLPKSAAVYFVGAPLLTENTLNITQGGEMTLTSQLLNVTVTDGSTPGQVVFTVIDLQHATIIFKLTGTPVNNFTLAQLQADDIEIIQDGSAIAPSYLIVVQGKQGQSSAQSQTNVSFSSHGVYAPQLVSNYLSVI